MKVAKLYIKKLAMSPTSETVKPVLSKALDVIKNQYPDLKVIKGFSNINVQNNVDYVHLSFILDVDKTAYNEAAVSSRKNIIKPWLEKNLPGYFGNTTIQVDYSEYPV
jgi:hypothetical protein